jgi:hypothetical protein
MSMATPVTFSPAKLVFTASGGAYQEIQCEPVPTNARVTATVLDPDSIFKIDRVVAYDISRESVDPGELPPGHKGPPPKETIYTETGRTDGSTPLAVSQGQNLTIGVQLKWASEPTTDAHRATLEIHGDTWDPVTVILSVNFDEISTVPTVPSLTVKQGQTVDLPVQVTSLAGPDTDVNYELWPEVPGITLQEPATLHVSRGASQSYALHLAAAPDTPLDNYQINIVESAFGGQQRDSMRNITLTVLPAPAPPPPPPSYTFRIDRMQVEFQRAATGHSDDDWLILVVRVDDQVYELHKLIGRTIHSGDTLNLGSDYQLGPFPVLPDSEVLVIITILSLGEEEDVAKQASGVLQISGQVVGFVGKGVSFVNKTWGDVISGVGSVVAGIGTGLGLLARDSCNGPVVITQNAYSAKLLEELTLNRSTHIVTNHYADQVSPKRCGMAPSTHLTFSVVPG